MSLVNIESAATAVIPTGLKTVMGQNSINGIILQSNCKIDIAATTCSDLKKRESDPWISKGNLSQEKKTI